MAPKPTTNDGPSYPMAQFSTGGSSYTNAVPEEESDSHLNATQDAELSDPNTYPHPPQEAPPVYSPPNRHSPGHTPLRGGYGSQQPLVEDEPSHPPPVYSKYTTAAQKRWARSSRIARWVCVGIIIGIIVLIVAVGAGVGLTRNNGSSPNNGSGGFGPGSGNGPGGQGGSGGSCASDAGNICTRNSDCSSGFCSPAQTCAC